MSSLFSYCQIATSQPPQPPRENSSGCVRTEPIPRRKQRNHDAKFKFLAFGGVSSLDTDSSALTTEQQQQQGSTNVKEVTGPGRVILFSLAMQYRQMRANKQAVVVGHSSIHSKGLFANKTFDKDDMVIEYVGEVIGQKVADRRYWEAGVFVFLLILILMCSGAGNSNMTTKDLARTCSAWTTIVSWTLRSAAMRRASLITRANPTATPGQSPSMGTSTSSSFPCDGSSARKS